MARNFATESEFGLPVLPDPFGNAIPEGATGAAAITAITDADAIKAGAGSDGLAYTDIGLVGALREIYAHGDGSFGDA